MDTNLKSLNNTGVVLVSHGSSLPYAEQTFTEIKNKFIKETGLPTEIGYMKVSKPTIAGAIDILKKNKDINRIIALPVFLAAGIHTKIDIPLLLGLDALEIDPRCPDGNYPNQHYLSIADDVDFDGEIKLINPIGPHPYLLDIIDKRIEEALGASELEDVKTGILLVSHGSRLSYNKEFISTVHEMFNEKCEYPNDFGFMELETPNIPTAINKLLENNDIKRLVVIPVFIAPGVHTTSDIPTILGLKELEEHSHDHNHEHHHHHHHLEAIEFDGEILYPEPIGADDILIDILKEKIENNI